MAFREFASMEEPVDMKNDLIHIHLKKHKSKYKLKIMKVKTDFTSNLNYLMMKNIPVMIKKSSHKPETMNTDSTVRYG